MEQVTIHLVGTMEKFCMPPSDEIITHLKKYDDFFISSLYQKSKMSIDVKSRDDGKINCSKVDYNDDTCELKVAVDPYDILPNLNLFLQENQDFHTENIEDLASCISKYFYENAHDYFNVNSIPDYQISSPVGPIPKVIERVELCNKMEKEELKDILYWDYEGLCAYLFLTCFDILGARNNYIHFGEWVVTKKKEYVDYRNFCLREIEKCDDYQQKTQKLHQLYLEKFGVNKSFRFFVNCILSEKERSLLFGLDKTDLKVISENNGLTDQETLIVKSIFKGMVNVEYASRNSSGKYDLIYEESRPKLLKIIQGIRNNFTHNGFSIKGFSPTHDMSVFQKKNNHIQTQLNKYIKILSEHLQCPLKIVNNLTNRLFQKDLKNNNDIITNIYFNTLINRLKFIVIRGIERRINLLPILNTLQEDI